MVQPNYGESTYGQQQQFSAGQVPMAQPMQQGPQFEIPMAQPYDPQSGYRYDAQSGYRSQPMPPGYVMQQVPYGPNGMMGYAGNVERVTLTQPYCGPLTCMIGLVICFFTGAGCLVACCPCDTETVTYVNGVRVDY